ncbi:MAG: DNA polymerase III subunit delta [Betaproteobacteria bacterium AqS2]|uniref:DNA polymerase III subunit delta n=1 Tax=Candidatus Amphirhobacter heronislandensis TaxID=1732024 RepID=A0A930XWK0_9GAMM|nr:DNA polymerase III subunit delta [Betaproteobacteria bacterium AqS2]
MIDSEKLGRHLAEDELAPAYLVTSDQPYLQGQDRDALRAAFACEERHLFFGDAKDAVAEAAAVAATGSLFSSSVLVELLYPGEIAEKAAAELVELAETAAANNVRLLVGCAGLSRPRNWKNPARLEEAFTRVNLAEIPAARLAGWIESRATRLGLRLDREAAGLLAELHEGNPDMAAMELEKLLLRHGEEPVGLAELQGGDGADHSIDSVFSLNGHLARCDARRTIRALRHFRATREEPTLVVWSLASQIRAMRAMQERTKAWGFFPPATRRAMQDLARRMPPAHLLELNAALSRADLAAKGLLGPGGDIWLILERFCAAFIYAAKHGRLVRKLIRS